MGRPWVIHVICDLWTRATVSVDAARQLLREAAQAGTVCVLELVVIPFPHGGWTGVAVLAESHIAVHTWPERQYIAVDLFSCNRTLDTNAVINVFRRTLSPTHMEVKHVERASVEAGIFIEHAPDVPEERRYRPELILEACRSQHQSITAFYAPRLGRVLALDDVVQVAEIDAFVYHELITHPALCAHPSPKVVAIAGGGDGHTLIEVLKHPAVEVVHLLEHDSEVIEIARRYFQGVEEALADPRVQITVSDAIRSLCEIPTPLDVLICDMIDPVGQAERFFAQNFYKLAAEILGPDGILVTQTESLHFHPGVVRRCLGYASRSFRHVRLLTGAMATYPGAWWIFVVASKANDPSHALRRPAGDTRLYVPESHSWYFLA
jgi:spermidine synthase